MRYLWDMYPLYQKSAGRVTRILFTFIAHYMRIWDRSSADRVDHYIANSSFISRRIQKFYKKKSHVIFPPVNVNEFDHTQKRDDFYFCLGQLTAYKKIDIAVEAFNQSGLPLIIIGEGEQLESLRKKANANITLLGRQSFEVVKDHLQHCKALVFPGVEDFGIVPVEAQAAGAPVIAYAKGGVFDTVIEGKTGLFFHDQSVESLIDAVNRVESGEYSFDVNELRKHAKKFSREEFKRKISAYLQELNLDIDHS